MQGWGRRRRGEGRGVVVVGDSVPASEGAALEEGKDVF